MRIYYYQVPDGNFGDELNSWIWGKVLSHDLASYYGAEDSFVGIGTLLADSKLCHFSKVNTVIFSTGAGYGNVYQVADFIKRAKVYCVRGPLTALYLNLPQESAVTDGGLLAASVIAPVRAKQHNAALMLHHDTHRMVGKAWREFCSQAGIRYIDPGDTVENVIHTLNSSKLVITEAMHGAIIADAFRVPWIPVCTSPNILDFKWHDWCLSMELEHAFTYMPPVDLKFTTDEYESVSRVTVLNGSQIINTLREMVRNPVTRLSSSTVHAARLSALLRLIAQLEQDGLNS